MFGTRETKIYRARFTFSLLRRGVDIHIWLVYLFNYLVTCFLSNLDFLLTRGAGCIYAMRAMRAGGWAGGYA